MRTSPLEIAGRIKVISGVVDYTGAITSGTEFTVIKTATGVYQLRFNNIFANMTKLNIVVTSLFAGGYTATVAGTGTPGDGPIQIQTYTSAVVIADSPFGFVISGLAKHKL